MEYGKMTRLDMHVHCNSTDMNDLQFLAEQCRRMGTVICLSGGTRYGAHDYVTNEEVIEICKKFPDCFIPLAKLDLPVCGNGRQRLQMYLSLLRI